MPTILKKASKEVHELIREAMVKYHPDLVTYEVTVDAMFAALGDDDDSEKPPLKLHGYPCVAIVKINPYKLRVKGLADAEITIDEAGWQKKSPAERLALIDHELAHLVVAKDKDGNAKSDDLGRPKLKMRLHCVEVGWFLDVAQRHGEASAEIKQARQIQEAHGQLLFDWPEGPPPIRLGGV